MKLHVVFRLVSLLILPVACVVCTLSVLALKVHTGAHEYLGSIILFSAVAGSITTLHVLDFIHWVKEERENP